MRTTRPAHPSGHRDLALAAFDPPPVSFRASLGELALFEPVGAYVRVVAGLAIAAAVVGVPVMLVLINSYALPTRAVGAALGLALFVAGWVCPPLAVRRAWERPVRRRLAEWRRYEPGMTHVSVLMDEAHVSAVLPLLARAGLNVAKMNVINRLTISEPIRISEARPTSQACLAVVRARPLEQVDHAALSAMIRDVLGTVPAAIGAERINGYSA
jgi:hypothetical protein